MPDVPLATHQVGQEVNHKVPHLGKSASTKGKGPTPPDTFLSSFRRKCRLLQQHPQETQSGAV